MSNKKYRREIPYGDLKVLILETEEISEPAERILRGTGWELLITEESFPEPDFESSSNVRTENELVSAVLMHKSRRVDVCPYKRNVVFEQLLGSWLILAEWLSSSFADKKLLEDESIVYQKAMGHLFSNPTKALDLLESIFLRRSSVEMYRLPFQTEFAQDSLELLHFDSRYKPGVFVNRKRYSSEQAMAMSRNLNPHQRVDLMVYDIAVSSDEENPEKVVPISIFENEEWGIIEAFLRVMQDKTSCRDSFEGNPDKSGPVRFARWLLSRTNNPLVALAGMAEYVDFDLEDLSRYGWGMIALEDLRKHKALWAFLSMMDFVKDGGFIEIMERQEKTERLEKGGTS